MLLVVEIIMCVYGAIVLINGRARLGRKIVTGRRARWSAVPLIAPLPIAFTLGGILGFQIAQTGNMQRFADMINTLACLEISGVGLAVLAHLTIISSAPQYELASGTRATSSTGYTGYAQAPSPTLPDVLTVAEAAQYLRVSEDEILIMIRSGRLQATRIGTEWRITRQAIDDLMRTTT